MGKALYHASDLVEQHINEHLPADQLRILQIAETDERRQLDIWAKAVRA